MRFLNENSFRGKKQKKNKKKVTLLLERDGDFKEIELNFGSKLQLLRKVKSLSRLNSDHCNLISTHGDPGKERAMFDKVISGLVPSAKEMLQFAGLPGLPGFLKKYFSKGELKND